MKKPVKKGAGSIPAHNGDDAVPIINFRKDAVKFIDIGNFRITSGHMLVDGDKNHPCAIIDWEKPDAARRLRLPVIYDWAFRRLTMLGSAPQTANFLGLHTQTFTDSVTSRYNDVIDTYGFPVSVITPCYFREIETLSGGDKHRQIRKYPYYSFTAIIIPCLARLKRTEASRAALEFEMVWQRVLDSFFIVGHALDESRVYEWGMNAALVPPAKQQKMNDDREFRKNKHKWLSTKIWKYTARTADPKTICKKCFNMINLGIDFQTAQARAFATLTLDDHCYGLSTFRAKNQVPYWSDTANSQEYVHVGLTDHVEEIYHRIWTGLEAGITSVEKPHMLDEVVARMCSGQQDDYRQKRRELERNDLSTENFWVRMIRNAIIQHYREHLGDTIADVMEHALSSYEIGSGKFKGGITDARDCWFESYGINAKRFSLIRKVLIEHPDLTPRQVMEQGLA